MQDRLDELVTDYTKGYFTRRGFLAKVEKSEPGWVAADPGAVELLHERGVRHAVTDAPSWGAAEDGQPGHVAGLRHGMTWTEGATNLGSLPVRG
nr:hypothetical protein [Actinomycetota bacterium]